MCPQLPQFQNDDQAFQLMQNRWGSILTPVINNPLNNATILKAVSLVSGSNTINHLLSRKLQGWTIVRINAAATIYDVQDANQTPNQTLVLVADNPAVVDIAVF